MITVTQTKRLNERAETTVRLSPPRTHSSDQLFHYYSVQNEYQVPNALEVLCCIFHLRYGNCKV